MVRYRSLSPAETDAWLARDDVAFPRAVFMAPPSLVAVPVPAWVRSVQLDLAPAASRLRLVTLPALAAEPPSPWAQAARAALPPAAGHNATWAVLLIDAARRATVFATNASADDMRAPVTAWLQPRLAGLIVAPAAAVDIAAPAAVHRFSDNQTGGVPPAPAPFQLYRFVLRSGFLGGFSKTFFFGAAGSRVHPRDVASAVVQLLRQDVALQSAVPPAAVGTLRRFLGFVARLLPDRPLAAAVARIHACV